MGSYVEMIEKLTREIQNFEETFEIQKPRDLSANNIPFPTEIW
jgi:hypothetical protein